MASTFRLVIVNQSEFTFLPADWNNNAEQWLLSFKHPTIIMTKVVKLLSSMLLSILVFLLFHEWSHLGDVTKLRAAVVRYFGR